MHQIFRASGWETTVWPKLFKVENFQGFLPGLKNFTLEHFGPSKMPLKTYFQSQV